MTGRQLLFPCFPSAHQHARLRLAPGCCCGVKKMTIAVLLSFESLESASFTTCDDDSTTTTNGRWRQWAAGFPPRSRFLCPHQLRGAPRVPLAHQQQPGDVLRREHVQHAVARHHHSAVVLVRPLRRGAAAASPSALTATAHALDRGPAAQHSCCCFTAAARLPRLERAGRTETARAEAS